MALLGDMSIKGRLRWVIMLTSLVAVIIGSLVSMVFSAQSRKASLQRDIGSLAEIISDNCLVSILYNIPQDADKMLASLRKRSSIIEAVIHNVEGEDFAIYLRNSNVEAMYRHLPDRESNEPGSSITDAGYMHVWQPIVFDGKYIGHLHIFDDMSDVRQSLRHDIMVLSIVVLVVMAVAFLMTVGLHSLISRPLGYLAGVAKKISKGGDYTVRAERRTGGEIGILVESFNDMLDHIETTNSKLEMLVQELEDKNVELERFTYTVSHDLKSPLITIKGFVGQLRKHMNAKDQERVSRDVLRIEEAADKMFDLLKDLLDLSRVGRVVGESKRVGFNEIVSSALSQLDGVIKENGVEVIVTNGMPEVTVDTMRLSEVMQNLIENAVKFMGDQPAPKIFIGCRAEGERNVFFVRDNGVGIEPEYREKVFGLFEQLNQLIGGTGIGLTIVRRIIDIHNGEIWIEEGEDGIGTTFCFTVPTSVGLNNKEITNAG